MNILYENKLIKNLDDYEIIREIKRSTFGEISLIREKTKNLYFAVKENLLENEEEQKYSEREIEILMNVHHETIIDLKGFSYYNFAHKKSLTFIMEYMEKGSLDKLLDDEHKGLLSDNYDNTNRQIIMIGIAKGMSILHSKNIIHRDLKPGNVLLNSNLEPKISDFGLSKYYDPKNSRNTQSLIGCGSTCYMAPEVITSTQYDNKADVYSFGIMMYEIITSTTPYPEFKERKETGFTFQTRVIKGERPIFTNTFNINQALKNLICDCWDHNPNSRPTFSELYQILSQNKNYFLSNVDNDIINEYIEKVDYQPDLFWCNVENTDCFTENDQSITNHGHIKKGVVNSTSQKVVFKHLKTKENIDKKYDSLKNEAETMKTYSHPAIQKIFGFCSPKNIKSESVLISPFREKYSLDHHIDKNFNHYEPNEEKVELDVVMKYLVICGICSAMEYIEEQKKFHGDLNPSNILIDINLYPYIIGFGLRKKYSTEELKDDKKLLINYCSPEIIEGKDCSIESDVYSFGLIVNQMFTNEIPFHCSFHHPETIDKIVRKEKPQISEEIPESLRLIVENCLSEEPDKRNSFKIIMEKLKNSLKDLQCDYSIVNTYLDTINSMKKMPSSFFRPLIPIVVNPSEFRNLEQNQSPIIIDLLESAFSNRPIQLVLVFGECQTGKSAFLRTLTGNNAFYSGTDEKSTTKGILLDGPYSSDDLINRVQMGLFNKECLIENIKNGENPAIYFLDSQGTGDKLYEEYYRKILERVHYIFYSVSDICINVTNTNEYSMKNKTYMLLNTTEICRTMFLVRQKSEEIQEQIQVGTREAFINAQKVLHSKWDKENDIVFSKYCKDSIKTLPLYDNKSPNNYLCSVSNVLFEILGNLKKYDNEKNITQDIHLRSLVLFSFIFDQINEGLKTQTNLPNYLAKSSNAEKDLFTLICYFQQYIKDCFENYNDLKMSIQEVGRCIETLIECVSNIYGPFILGSRDILLGDCFQYLHDINKDIDIISKAMINNWPISWGMLFKKAFSFASGILYSSTSTQKTDLYSTTKGTEDEKLAIFHLLNDGSRKKDGNEVYKNIITFSIPFLWERNLSDKGIQIIEFSKISKYIKNSNPEKNKWILALEQPGCDLSFILQAMTGVKCDFRNIKQVVAKFGPFEGLDLVNKTRKNLKPLKTEIDNSKITILYLKGFRNDDICKIPFQENIYKSFTAVKMKEELKIIPHTPMRFWVLTLIPELPILLLSREKITSMIPELTKTNPKLDNPKLFQRFPIIGNSFDFSQSGPRTNSTLRYAFRAIYFEEKIIKEIFDDPKKSNCT